MSLGSDHISMVTKEKALIADEMSNISSHSDSMTDETILDNFISAYMLIIPYISNLTEAVINATSINDDIRRTSSFISKKRTMMFTDITELEVIWDSVARLSSYISKHDELMNVTHTDVVISSFDRMMSLISNHILSFYASEAEECVLYAQVVYIITGILSGIGIAGNAVAFNIFGKLGQRNSSIVLLRTLAVMDSILLVFAILSRICPFGYFNCNFVSYKYLRPTFTAAQIAAVWTSVLLGINRYIVVCHPFRASKWCTIVNTRRQLALVVFVALVYAFPIFFEMTRDKESGDNVWGVVPWAKNYYYMIIYRDVLSMILLFIAPMAFQLILSIRISVALYAARKERQQMGSNVPNTEKYVTRMVLCILIIYLICYTPTAIESVMHMVHGEFYVTCWDVLFYYQPVVKMFKVLNSSINCVIYAIFNPTFRNTFTSVAFGRATIDG